jgi:hypothetical protein
MRVLTASQHLATLHRTITETRRPAALEVSLRSFLFQCQIAACSAVPVDCVA